MALEYKVYISESEPDFEDRSVFWIKPSTGEMKIFLSDWQTVAAGSAISSYSEGVYVRTLSKQEFAPAEEIGKLWYSIVSDTIFVFLTEWVPYTGG